MSKLKSNLIGKDHFLRKARLKVLTERTMQSSGYKCRAILNKISGLPIIFLHGLSYTSEVWQRIGVFGLLRNKNVPFLALDMPYGLRSECHPKTRSLENNIAFLRESIENVFSKIEPVLVGASIGGNFALKYATLFPVKGLLLIAPSRSLEQNLLKSYENLEFPVRIIWGTEDKIISGEEMRVLADKMFNAKLVSYEGASHSAYNDQPEKFKRDLLELYAKAEDRQL